MHLIKLSENNVLIILLKIQLYSALRHIHLRGSVLKGVKILQSIFNVPNYKQRFYKHRFRIIPKGCHTFTKLLEKNFYFII